MDEKSNEFLVESYGAIKGIEFVNRKSQPVKTCNRMPPSFKYFRTVKPR